MSTIKFNYPYLSGRKNFGNARITEYTERHAIYKVQPETLFAPVENCIESVTTAEQLVVVSSKDYCNNHIYDKDGYLNTVLFDNGYISSGQYHFYIKDYLCKN